MGLPINDIALSNKPVAFLISGINTLKIIKLKNIRRGFFIDSEYGIFMIDRESHIPLIYGKQAIYTYDVRSAKPLDMLLMKELDEFADKNGLMTITPKHVREGEKLRIFSKSMKKQDEDPTTSAHERLTAESREHQEDIQKELNYINEGLNKENESLIKQNKQPLEISPEDYANFILDRLVKKSLITFEESTMLKSKLVNGILTLDDFARELQNIHKVEIHMPISVNAQKFLDYYRTYNPNDVFQYISEAKGLGKDIKDLGQPAIKNLLPLKWIFGVGVVGIIIVAVLTQIDLGNIGNLIPFLNK